MCEIILWYLINIQSCDKGFTARRENTRARVLAVDFPRHLVCDFQYRDLPKQTLPGEPKETCLGGVSRFLEKRVYLTVGLANDLILDAFDYLRAEVLREPSKSGPDKR